jgi:hypothetical protein
MSSGRSARLATALAVFIALANPVHATAMRAAGDAGPCLGAEPRPVTDVPPFLAPDDPPVLSPGTIGHVAVARPLAPASRPLPSDHRGTRDVPSRAPPFA